MKKNRVMLIIQLVFMYLSQIPFLLADIIIMNFSIDNVVGILLIVGLVLDIIVIHIAIYNLIIGFISIFKKRSNVTKDIMIYKLILIPWFLINFYICLIFIAGTLNPWLFIFAPLLAFIFMCTTYLYMFSFSMYDIGFLLNRMIKKEIIKNKLDIISIILLHFFCLDVAFSIVSYVKHKNIE